MGLLEKKFIGFRFYEESLKYKTFPKSYPTGPPMMQHGIKDWRF